MSFPENSAVTVRLFAASYRSLSSFCRTSTSVRALFTRSCAAGLSMENSGVPASTTSPSWTYTSKTVPAVVIVMDSDCLALVVPLPSTVLVIEPMDTTSVRTCVSPSLGERSFTIPQISPPATITRTASPMIRLRFLGLFHIPSKGLGFLFATSGVLSSTTAVDWAAVSSVLGP